MKSTAKSGTHRIGMAQFQRFGGAMLTPVLFFMFSGIVVAITSVLINPSLVGSIANEGTAWYGFWTTINNGGWTVFNNMEVLFAIGLAYGLSDNAKGRAALEAFVLYMTFNVFVNNLLTFFGPTFGIDLATAETGVKAIGGITTLDTGFLGAILVAAIIVWLHNRFFEKRLPDWLAIFQGSALVAAVGFPVMFVLAGIFCFVWPTIQEAINSLQYFLSNAGLLGVWIYTFLEKALLPTGLHHFIYSPFQYGPAVVEGGITYYWMEHLQEFATSTAGLTTIFPEGGFQLQGLSNFFGIPGIALAFYFTSRKENRKKMLALCVPGVITACFCGITEPFDYTFLFVAPVLFFVHAFLAATFATIQYAFGLSGDMGGGLIDIFAKNIIPMWQNHWGSYVVMFIIGAISIAVYFIVFRYLILKFDFPTPGRGEDVEFHTKSDYREKLAAGAEADAASLDEAAGYLVAFGGPENIKSITNCMTRLRVTVNDPALVKDDKAFTEWGAKGVVRNGDAFQVIVGLSVPQIAEAFKKLVDGRAKMPAGIA